MDDNKYNNHDQMSEQEKIWKQQQAHWKKMKEQEETENEERPRQDASHYPDPETMNPSQERIEEGPPRKNEKEKYQSSNQDKPQTKHPFLKSSLQMIAAAIIGSIITISIFTQTNLFDAQSNDATVPDSHQQAENPDSDTKSVGSDDSIADIVDRSSEAIVGIVNMGEQENPFFETTDEVQNGVGSGVIYKVDNDSAYVVTNNHVIEDASGLEVHLENGDVVEGDLVGTDPLTDIAIVKIKGDFDIKPVEFGDSDDLRTGDRVIAIGNPLGLDLSRTVTEGIISARDRTIPVQTSKGEWEFEVLQTDAAINPGNSGGALLDSNGKLIGINSLKIKESGVEGLGFAIPSNTVKDIANQISEDGQVERPYIGVGMRSLQEIPDYYLPEIPDDVKGGVVVLSVDEDSPAGKAGIKVEDVITAINGEKVKNDQEFRAYLYKELDIGDKATLDVYRNGKKQEISVTLTSNAKANN